MPKKKKRKVQQKHLSFSQLIAQKQRSVELGLRVLYFDPMYREQVMEVAKTLSNRHPHLQFLPKVGTVGSWPIIQVNEMEVGSD